MKNLDKTKEQLIEELSELRQRTAEFEKLEFESRRMEEMLRASLCFFEIANKSTEMYPMLKDFVKELKKYISCANVGLRILDEGGNIPYQAYEGFSKRFYELESPLSIKSDECMCINVIKGDFDPKLPFYTEGGSFYMNNTTRFLATVSEEDKGQTRNICNEVGYESVALIPICLGEHILGLIHVADSRENMIPLERVEWLELVAMELGTAIDRLRTEVRYKDMIEFSNDIVCRADERGNWLFLSPAVKGILGYEPAEMIGKSAFDFMCPEDIPSTQKAHESIVREGKSVWEYENRYIGKDGRKVTIAWNSVALRDEQGNICGTQGVGRDITARKRAEEELFKKGQWLTTTLRSIGDAVIATDAKGIVSFMNHVAEDLTGWDEAKAVGKPLKDVFNIINEQTGEPAENPVARVIREGIVVGLANHTVLIAKDGTKRAIADSGAPMKDVEGNVIGVVMVFRDITERKKAEEENEKLQAQLVQSEKMAGIGTLTSGIAHEFNNLLQIMSGHAEYAQRTKKLKDMEEALDIVGETSERVSKIIKDLLTFSRREPLERKSSNISELIEFVLSMTEEQLKKNNITVVREYGRVPKVEVNEGELQQVFLNMVMNARDAMLPKGGPLEIGIKKVKDNVEISFTDTGKGIKEENLGKVFEPFYTTKGVIGGDTRTQGIGLGLSVSYGIVERHDGTIEVESEVGKGTTFTIRLPLKKQESRDKRIVIEEKVEKAKPKSLDILVVDDEPDICSMLTKWLSADGHKVKSVLMGSKAINLVKKKHYDVVFLDIVMPGIPGDEVLVKIKEISPKVKVIMITGSLMKKSSWKELKQKGASGYIKKPFKMEDIKKFL